MLHHKITLISMLLTSIKLYNICFAIKIMKKTKRQKKNKNKQDKGMCIDEGYSQLKAIIIVLNRIWSCKTQRLQIF